MVGASISESLIGRGYENVITDTRYPKTDLTNQLQTLSVFNEYKPDYVILAAAKVGGIYANSDIEKIK